MTFIYIHAKNTHTQFSLGSLASRRAKLGKNQGGGEGGGVEGCSHGCPHKFGKLKKCPHKD